MMDPNFGIRPDTPTTPLYPISPERANRQPHLQSSTSALGLSPLSSRLNSPFGSPTRCSDVRNKVAQFDNLGQDAFSKRKDNEAALKRAILGREEAESEGRRLKEEVHSLRKQADEARAREKKSSHRVESIMEEMQRLKESQGKAQAVYEKEVRRARKEAFKSSSEVVKLREELKTTRDRFKMTREDIELQKRKIENREKEAFSAKYQLVGVEEELEQMKQKLKLVEEERDSLRMSLKEEEVARIAAEGKIQLLRSQTPDEFSSPKKQKRHLTPLSFEEETIPRAIDDLEENEQEKELELLRDQLSGSQTRVKEMKEIIELMNVECQLKQCMCRLAEMGGERYVYDKDYDKTMAERGFGASTFSTTVSAKPDSRPPTANEKKSRTTAMARQHAPKREEEDLEKTPRPSTPPPTRPHVQPTPQELIEFSPSTGTFRKVSAALANMRDLPPLPPSPTPSAASRLFVLQPHAPSTSPSLLDLMDSQSPSENCQLIPSLPVSANSSFNRPPAMPKTPRPMPDLAPVSTKAPKTAPPLASAPISAPLRSAAPTPVPHSASTRTITTTYTTSVPLSSGDSPIKTSVRPKSVAEGLISARSGSSTSVSSAPERGRGYPYSPGATKTKEEALQAIQRWREGRARARSVTAPNATPRRPPVGGGGVASGMLKGEPRRDISAPQRKTHK